MLRFPLMGHGILYFAFVSVCFPFVFCCLFYSKAKLKMGASIQSALFSLAQCNYSAGDIRYYPSCPSYHWK